MKAGLVDTHAHLMDRAFAGELPGVLERAWTAGLVAIVCVGYDAPTSEAAVALAQEHPRLLATVGIHPNESGVATPRDFEAVARLAERDRVVAIGETGLDYYRDRTSPDKQREALQWHLDLAGARDLPVVIHQRGASEHDLAPALEAFAAGRSAKGPPGILHCYSSLDSGYLRRMLDAGFYVSLAGPLTFPSADVLRSVVRTVPLGRLLVETDAPFLAPHPLRGRRNEPAFVSHTAQRLGEMVGLGLDAITRRLRANTLNVFPTLTGALPQAS